MLYYDYVKSFKGSDRGNIFDVAEKLLNGMNKNEILLINKISKNRGFFEKFFDFFN